MKILFIGNRWNVVKQLLDEDITIMAQAGSCLVKELTDRGIKHIRCHFKSDMTRAMEETEWDVLISNGCPYILPVIPGKVMINIHPAYLPNGKGKHPINGLFMNNGVIGATMHHMTDEMDSGNIIHREYIHHSDDIDLGLAYYMSFELEGVVFAKGWAKMINSNFQYEGEPMVGDGWEFHREPEKMVVDFSNMLTKEILKRVRAYGIEGQGCKDEHNMLVIYHAEMISNCYLLRMFATAQPGEIVLRYDGKLLIKTIDGLVKVTRFIQTTNTMEKI